MTPDRINVIESDDKVSEINSKIFNFSNLLHPKPLCHDMRGKQYLFAMVSSIMAKDFSCSTQTLRNSGEWIRPETSNFGIWSFSRACCNSDDPYSGRKMKHVLLEKKDRRRECKNRSTIIRRIFEGPYTASIHTGYGRIVDRVSTLFHIKGTFGFPAKFTILGFCVEKYLSQEIRDCECSFPNLSK